MKGQLFIRSSYTKKFFKVVHKKKGGRFVGEKLCSYILTTKGY